MPCFKSLTNLACNLPGVVTLKCHLVPEKPKRTPPVDGNNFAIWIPVTLYILVAVSRVVPVTNAVTVDGWCAEI